MRAARRPTVEWTASTAGIVAFVAIALGCVVSALDYAGAAGEPYSPLNHWISELGQEGVAARAAGFNVSLVVGGIGFVLFISGLAITSRSRLRWAFGPVGVVAGLGGLFVGLYPMNHPTEHVLAASTFFNLGWISVGLASIAFVVGRDPRFPPWLAVVGAATVACFIAFLVSLRVDDFSRTRMASTGAITGRPDVWTAPILEWGVLVGIMAWTLLASLTWRRELRHRSAAVAVAA